MNSIKIRVIEIDKFKLIETLINKKIYFNYIKGDGKRHYLIIDLKNLKEIKKKYKVKVISYYGTKRIEKFIKKHYLFLLSFLWGLFLLYILSRTIFEVEIKTDNNELKEKLIKELNDYNITKYGRIKNYKKITEIKNKIIFNNNDSIEWLEIKRDGTKYEILLTERIIVEKETKDKIPRHMVASKDALIKHITSSNGDVIKEVNEYVKKGEIIISGDIYKSDKLITRLRAEGKIFGEVWYLVKTTVPFKYIEYVRTGEVINHYYVEAFGGSMTLLGKYDTNKSMNTKATLIDKPYLKFKLIKEAKELYEYKEFKITKDEAQKEAIKRSDKGIKNKLKENEYVISKKVLNIYPNTDKIEIEIFYKVYENITDTLIVEEFVKEGE